MSGDVPVPDLVVRAGSPDAAELAALAAVLASLAQVADPPPHERPLAGGWRSHYRTLRREHRPGPGAWRASVR